MKTRIPSALCTAVVAAIVLFAATASALSIVDTNAHMDRFMFVTTDSVTVTFDRAVNPSTVDADSFYLTRVDDPAKIAGNLSVDGATVTFDPTARLAFGGHYFVHITTGVEGNDASPFDGVYPLGQEFVANIPNDFEIATWDGEDVGALFIESNMLVGYDPLDPEATVWEDYWTYPGCSATEAWKITTGDPRVIIAIIDNGMGSMDDPELADNYFLNRGELPLPNVEGTPCDDYDCNGDGRFNWRDYADDDRLAAYDDAMPDNLIAAFKDGVDDDGNGLVDDISGYDFFRGVPEPVGVDEFPEGDHGGGRAHDAASVADNGHGGKPGVCPNCTILPIRVGEAILGDYNAMANGAAYAVSMGAQIISVANGTFNYSRYADDVFYDAYQAGSLTIAASGDEIGFHHVYPAHGEMAMSIKAVLPVPGAEIDLGELLGIDIDLDIDIGDIATFVESYCTNFGSHTSVTAPTGACSSHATSITTGLAGLVLSRAYEVGIELSANELLQILQTTTDDIKDACLTIRPGGCQEGWDEHWGYGRVNALRAVQALGDPDKGVPAKIPPEVEITSPRWFDLYHPGQTPTVDIDGMVYARGDAYSYEVDYAVGVEPFDSEFTVIDSGTGTERFEGTLATLDITSIFDAAHLEAAPTDHDDFTVTIRVRAHKTVDGDVVTGEYRKTIAVYNDFEDETGLLPGFPIEFDNSAESAAVLWDLAGTGTDKLDIIFGGGDGYVRVYRYSDETETWAMAPGFPVNCTPEEKSYPDAIVGSPAVGNLMGDDTAYIVVTTYGGNVYAIHPDGNDHAGGPFVEGFPVEAAKNDPYPNIDYGHGNAYISSPALADLDLDGMLEIITANYNLNIYAIKPVDEDQDGVADDLPGWPVLAKSEAGNVDPDKECGQDVRANILVSPAVAILDPYSSNPDVAEYPSVVVGTGEVCDPKPEVFPDVSLGFETSRLYAIHHDGNDNPNGPFIEGWPAILAAPFVGAVPIPPLTVGVTSSPAIAHENGRVYIGTGTFFWPPQIISWEDGDMDMFLGVQVLQIGSSANGTFAHWSDNGMLQYLIPTIGVNFANLLSEFDTLTFQVSAYDVDNLLGHAGEGQLDDGAFFVNPIVADLDGDGLNELISGSGGFLLHAYNVHGEEPADWPKFTNHFITGSPAVGDLDGDGKLEVVLADHEGSLFAWNTTGPACNAYGLASEWHRFRHDERNSGWMNADVVPPAKVADLGAYRLSEEDGNLVTLAFTAPGDDWRCGFPASLDIRYSDDPDADLADPAVFEQAAKVPASLIGELPAGGEAMRLTLDLPDAVSFAVRAYDSDGNRSVVSDVATVSLTTSSSDDPNADDDADDEDDDEGCGCG